MKKFNKILLVLFLLFFSINSFSQPRFGEAMDNSKQLHHFLELKAKSLSLT